MNGAAGLRVEAARREPALLIGFSATLRSARFCWSVGPALAAWLALLAHDPGPSPLEICRGVSEGLLTAVTGAASRASGRLDLAEGALGWVLMVCAMMFPLIGPMVGHIAGRSHPTTRHRMLVAFVASYLAVWLAAAPVALGAALVLQWVAGAVGEPRLVAPLGCAAAALWQISPAKRRALNRCHGTRPIRAFGRAALADAAAFGLLHGWRCAASCLPVMALPGAGGHDVTAVAVIAALLLAERAQPQPQLGLSSAALAVLCLVKLISP